jgi:ATP-dependent DNA helicase RecG
MKAVDKKLQKIEYCIENGIYEQLEDNQCEIKDNSSSASDWNEVHKSACAFLNTNGGFIILGIEEREDKKDQGQKRYILKGYNEQQEEKIKQIPKQFNDEKGKSLNLDQFFPPYQVRDLLDKRVLVIYVDKLPEEQKYVYYRRKAWERKITGDHQIHENKIIAHQEYKQELEAARELLPVINATVNDLNVDKLNEYIQLLNREVKIENLKSDIESAMPFLTRKGFVKNNQPTTLGMLVCGDHIEDYLGGRCQVDCFVDSPIKGRLVAENKKILKDNILPLMEGSVSFVYKNMQVGVSLEKGGSSEPEYPEDIVRESVNNSLAHRDYSIDKYINLNIKPGESLEIRNPGSFKKQLLIEELNDKVPLRRIIPNTKPVNPKLADVLKVFNKWEGRGIGMATLTNRCLNNEINLPYYRFYDENDLGLFIPGGKLVDDYMDHLYKMYDLYIEKKLGGNALSDSQKCVLAYLYKSQIENENNHYTILLTSDNNRTDAIRTLKKAELIFKHPKSPDLHPVYLVDQELMKSDFGNELRNIFGGDYDTLASYFKDVLNVVYQVNNFSKKKTASANLTSTILYHRKNKKFVLKEFDNYKRSVRYYINQLDKKHFLKRKDGKAAYLINKDFKRTPSIFD